jgi:microcystin-dependent protein
MATPFLGQITVYPYNFPPKGWADCDGQLLPIRQYTALFSLLGTNYGGDGVNTFGLPNLQGRIPIGQGQLLGGADYVMGEAAGEENVTLVLQTMARHNPAWCWPCRRSAVDAAGLHTRAKSIIQPRPTHRLRPNRSCLSEGRSRTTTSSPHWCCAIASPWRGYFRHGIDLHDGIAATTGLNQAPQTGNRSL